MDRPLYQFSTMGLGYGRTKETGFGQREEEETGVSVEKSQDPGSVYGSGSEPVPRGGRGSWWTPCVTWLPHPTSGKRKYRVGRRD